MTQESLLANPLFRYGMTVPAALTVAFVGYQFFDGLTQSALYALALVELLVTPQFLKYAAT